MNTNDLIKYLSKSAGQSVRATSIKIGRNPDFLAATISRDSTPQCDTMADIAEACGYRLCVVPADAVPDNAVIIDKGE